MSWKTFAPHNKGKIPMKPSPELELLQHRAVVTEDGTLGVVRGELLNILRPAPLSNAVYPYCAIPLSHPYRRATPKDFDGFNEVWLTSY